MICDNITESGKTGYGDNCGTYLELCGTAGPVSAPMIRNCVPPSGGTGNIETVWLKNETSGCTPIDATVEQMMADPNVSDWKVILGATELYLNPGTIDKSTCYRRCTRREGCDMYTGEADPVYYVVTANCGNLLDCNDIVVSTGNGTIDIVYPGNFEQNAYQVFTESWQPTGISCIGSCGSNVSLPVTPGTYHVKVEYNTGSLFQICEVIHTVTVASYLLSNDQFNFETVKQEEFTELLWAHNKGAKVSDYVLERSLDGSNFEAIETQSSKGSASMELYTGYDLSPVIGDNYYRIKMDMLDGTVEYSEIKLVQFADLIDFSLFPNPANEFVKVNLETVVGRKDVKLSIFNSLGTELKTVEIDEVTSRYYTLDIRELKEGHYIIWMDIPNHKPQAKQMVVAKK